MDNYKSKRFLILRSLHVRNINSFVIILLIFLFSTELLAQQQNSLSQSLPEKTALKTILVDKYYPYTFVNDQGQPDGFSVDLMTAVTQVMDLDLIIDVDRWDVARERLKKGQIDFLPMMAYSKERAQYFDFSAPHTIAYDAFFVRNNSSKISTLKDLQNKKIIIMRDDQAHDFLRSLEAMSTDQFILIETLPEALRTLAAGEGDTALMPKMVGLFLIKKLKLSNLELSPVVIEEYKRPFSFAVKKGNQELLERLSQGFNIVKETDQYNAIYKKWFGILELHKISSAKVIKYIALIVLSFVSIGVILFLWTLSLKKQVRLRTKNLEEEIKERESAEAHLKESEERYSLAQKAANVGTWDWNIISGAVEWSEQIEPMFGFAPGEFGATYSAFLACVHIDDRKYVNDSVNAAVHEGEEYDIEFRIVQTNGTVRWISIKGDVFRDEAEEPIRMLGVIQDISEKKEAFERFRTVMDSLDALVYVADMDTYELLFVNKYGHDIWGDISGKTCWKFLQSNQTGPCNFCTNDRLLDADGNPNESFIWEFQNTLNNEWFECRDQAIHWLDGRLVRLEIASNITQRKNEEKKRIKLEEQLLQSQKMEAIGTLAGGIAHDFNNILAAILGYTEMAREDLPPESSIAPDLDEVLKAGNRAKELVKQILAFSRQSEQELRPIQIHLFVKEALKLLRSSIPSTIEIHQDIDPQCGTVLSDATQIHQITMNLCTNANHAMRETGGVLAVSMRSIQIEEDDHKIKSFELTPGSYVELAVSDSGVGMDKKTTAKIFNPYFTTKKKGEGTGLGLSVVHGIVKSFGGHITVYSEPGKGATFRLYLPRVTTTISSEEIKKVEIYPTGNENILIVDDEEVIVNMLKRMLTSLGYTVTSMTSSTEALQTFGKDPGGFDLIITDMTMPNMNGVELIQRIHRIWPDFPIILCTGFSELIDKERASILGISKYLMKPIVKRDLAIAVRKVLDNA
jgi:PAS domain S-box-containing protein